VHEGVAALVLAVGELRAEAIDVDAVPGVCLLADDLVLDNVAP
jgi:hypothetical protein